MSSSDLKKWNARYGQAQRAFPNPPEGLKHVVTSLIPGTVLDVASGEGAVALYLAQFSQFSVTALDISDIALNTLSAFAKEKDVQLSTVCADLDSLDFSSLESFDNICIYRYKPSAELLLELSQKLSLNGRLLLSTFNQRQHTEQGFNARFCLGDDEFEKVSDQLQLIEFIRADKTPFTDTYIWKKI